MLRVPLKRQTSRGRGLADATRRSSRAIRLRQRGRWFLVAGAVAVAAVAAGCGGSSPPSSHSSNQPVGQSDSSPASISQGGSTGSTDPAATAQMSDYSAWVGSVDNICDANHQDWLSSDNTALSELLAVADDPSFTPVPNDARAQEFWNSLEALKTAAQEYGAAQSNANAGAAALGDLNAAKDRVIAAATGIGAASCVTLAQD